MKTNQQAPVHFLYPSDPLKTRQPDDFYAAEFSAVKEAGFGTSVFSLEEFQGGSLREFPALPNATTIIYRGWMLSPDVYQALVAAIIGSGSQPLTDFAAYLSA